MVSLDTITTEVCVKITSERIDSKTLTERKAAIKCRDFGIILVSYFEIFCEITHITVELTVLSFALHRRKKDPILPLLLCFKGHAWKVGVIII